MTVSTATAKTSYPLPAEAVRPQSELAGLIDRHTREDGFHSSAIPRLVLIRYSQPSEPMPTVYEPTVCIVAQGRKQTMLAGQVYFYDPEKYLVVTVDLPMVGQVIEASPEKPYLCLALNLDPGHLSALMMEL